MNVCKDEVKPFPRVIDEIYFHSLDMRLLLNILTETNGLWAPLLILSLFDPNFRQLFNVSNSNEDFIIFELSIAAATCQSIEHNS